MDKTEKHIKEILKTLLYAIDKYNLSKEEIIYTIEELLGDKKDLN